MLHHPYTHLHIHSHAHTEAEGHQTLAVWWGALRDTREERRRRGADHRDPFMNRVKQYHDLLWHGATHGLKKHTK